MSLRNTISKTRNLAMIAALALSMNALGQYNSKVSADKSSAKSLETTLHDSKKEVSDKSDNYPGYYKFNDINFALEKYDKIPPRDRNKPAYGDLVYDVSNSYFCYEFDRSGKELHKAFIMIDKLLESNGLTKHEKRYPNIINHKKLPAIAPDSLPAGSVHNETFDALYPILNWYLSSDKGYFIHRAWRVPSQNSDVKDRTEAVKTHVIEALFNKNEYIIKIYK